MSTSSSSRAIAPEDRREAVEALLRKFTAQAETARANLRKMELRVAEMEAIEEATRELLGRLQDKKAADAGAIPFPREVRSR